MTELEQNRIFDISYEMRGLAATLVAASCGHTSRNGTFWMVSRL